MGTGGSMGGGSNSGPIGSSGPRAGLGSPGAQGLVGNYSGTPGGGGGSPSYVSQANTPEVRTYRDASGNTVKAYQIVSGGRLSPIGYKEVYSPSGQLLSSTKPMSSANNPMANPTVGAGGRGK